MRELCNTFRHLLYELAKCVSVCESDLNESLIEQLHKYEILQADGGEPKQSRPASPTQAAKLNQSTASSVGSPSKRPMRTTVVPDVSGILSLIEDPSLVSFVTEANADENLADLDGSVFNLNSCLEKLKMEADSLLHLSEKMAQKRVLDNKEAERSASLEEEDGLKSKKVLNLSLNGSLASRNDPGFDPQQSRHSLPLCLPAAERKTASSSELNEMKNQLVKAEQKRQQLENKLTRSLAEQQRLTEELRLAHIKVNSFIEGGEVLSEG